VHNVHRLGFYTDFTTMLVWAPYTCARERVVDGPAVDRCLAGKVFRWHGDSQTRILFNHAMLRLCGIPDLANKGFHTDQCVAPRADNNVDGCRLRAACYSIERHGDGVTEALLHDADVFVTNFWQWCAAALAYGGHMSASLYERNVRRYLLAVGGGASNVTADTDPTASMWTSAVGAHGFVGVFASVMRHMARALVSGDGAGRDKHVVWMETPPFPLHMAGGVVVHKDWRTPHRLRLFNAIARRWWAEGVRQLRQFAAVVQRRGGVVVPLHTADAHVDVTASLEADIAVSIDVAGRTTTQRVLVSYIPMTSRYTAIVGAAADEAHLTHPEALDSSTNAIFAAVSRCSAP
jgi:hypothetical protein